ncbi:unnamed protein product [Fusarium graminearum]|uniref:Small secreted protein n=1 Tax=Gibberella zeae (strain ATCC MYA-4620 / CBS 123657 / FGSC 9075 / NRRL 31084 / PH-1) TaxID=229533 RepID=A0A098DAQ6_GIBZE|nr:unnamed protein product [Fusarium graminearum]
MVIKAGGSSNLVILSTSLNFPVHIFNYILFFQMYPFTTFTSLLAIAGAVSATLDPAKSNTKGQYPKNPSCSPSKTSNAIQAAECAYNTRVSGKQTFAIFKVDHQYDKNNGAPYGTCEAYECDAPTSGEMTADQDYWTFFWK